MALLIRPYDDTHDRAQMTALFRAAWHAAYDAIDGPATIEGLIAALLDGAEPQMFNLPVGDTALVAENLGQISGGIRGHPRGGVVHLSGFYVQPSGMRCGTGRALLSELLRYCPPGSVIRADVRPTSFAALAFYTSQGFERVGSGRSHVGGNVWSDVIEMQRTLT